MSIDLNWSALGSSLSSKIVLGLNKQLSNTTRPSFIGPIEVTSLDFGTTAPDVELADMRDIFRDFLEDDDVEDTTSPIKDPEADQEEEDYEWVSRRASSQGMMPDGPAYHHLPPHVRYGHSPTTQMFSSLPSLASPRSVWSGGTSLGDFRQPGIRAPYGMSVRRPSSEPKFTINSSPSPSGSTIEDEPERRTSSPAPISPPPPQSDLPNLQLHFNITWPSDLRITLTTSLLINYPSPMFMSLPIKLSVTGLLFQGEVVVGYEGPKKRLHVCILDEMDPYGPIAKSKGISEPPSPVMPISHTPSDLDEEVRPSKHIPIGHRMLPSISIESEIGQTDSHKHVLKNVGRVEKFIQDMIRKTVEDELVFPNYHTIVL